MISYFSSYFSSTPKSTTTRSAPPLKMNFTSAIQIAQAHELKQEFKQAFAQYETMINAAPHMYPDNSPAAQLVESAQVSAGIILYEGRDGVPQNKAEGIKRLEAALYNDNEEAFIYLGALKLQGEYDGGLHKWCFWDKAPAGTREKSAALVETKKGNAPNNPISVKNKADSPIKAPAIPVPVAAISTNPVAPSQVQTGSRARPVKVVNPPAQVPQMPRTTSTSTSTATTVKTDTAQEIINKLSAKLDPTAKRVFAPLLQIESIGKVRKSDPLGLGDRDGCTARLILAGIQCGMITIDGDAGYESLAYVVNKTAQCLDDINSAQYIARKFADFQKNTSVQDALDKLLMHLKFKTGDIQFIDNGDGAHDRLSCNKNVDRAICLAMRQKGAIFIGGNHDYISVAKQIDEIQMGYYAKDDFANNPAAWEAHERQIYQNAYYHKPTNTIYLHHGICEYKGALRTAFNYEESSCYPIHDPFDPQKFVDHLNALPPPRMTDKVTTTYDCGSSTEGYPIYFIDFRPTVAGAEALGRRLGVRFVMGHSGSPDFKRTFAVGINTRSDGKFCVVAKRIGDYR